MHERVSYPGPAPEHGPPEAVSVSRRLFCMASAVAVANILREVSADDPVHEGRNESKAVGSLLIAGGGELSPEIHERFMELAGGEKAKIVVIPTASPSAEQRPHVEAHWDGGVRKGAFRLLHTRDRKEADDPRFVQPLREATGVWIAGGHQRLLREAYGDTLLERELHNVRSRGGVVGGTSAGASAMSTVMIEGGNTQARLGTGFGFLPEAVIDQHHRKYPHRIERLKGVVSLHPTYVGIGIDDGTALIVRDNVLTVMGDAHVKICRRLAGVDACTVQLLRAGETLDLRTMNTAVASTKRN